MDITDDVYSWNLYSLAEKICTDYKLNPQILKQLDGLKDEQKALSLVRSFLCHSDDNETIIQLIKDNRVLHKLVKENLIQMNIFFIAFDRSYIAKIYYVHDLINISIPDLLVLSQQKKFIYSILGKRYIGELRVFTHEYHSINDVSRQMSYEEIIISVQKSTQTRHLPKEVKYLLYVGIHNTQSVIQSYNGLTSSELVDVCDPTRFYEKICLDKKEAGTLIKIWIHNQSTKSGRQLRKS